MAAMTRAERTAMSEAEKLRTLLAALRRELIQAESATSKAEHPDHESEVRVEIARVEAELAEIEAEEVF
jgi:ribosomal protein L29